VHIVFFNRSYYPDTSATAQILAELCESLVNDHGHDVTVVTGVALLSSIGTRQRFRYFQFIQRERHRGVNVLRARGTSFSKQRFIGRFLNYVTYFVSACLISLRIERPDVIVSLTDPPIIGLAALVSARRFRTPFVMSFQDIFPEVAKLMEDFNSSAVNRFLQCVTSYLARTSDRAVVLGESMGRRLIETKRADPSRTVVIPPWADCAQIQPGPKRNRFSIANKLADRFVVMHSGNIGLSQGLDVLVDAAAYLESYPDILVVFVGDGVKKEHLQEKVRLTGLKNVSFLPYQAKEHLTESFASADIFVISLKRGLAGYIVPSKLYGILAAGRPFVASIEEDSEVAGVAKRFNCGLLAQPGDAAGLAKNILQLYANNHMRQRFGANAREAALLFDRKVQVKAYHDLFLQVSGSAGTQQLSRYAKASV
jgi:glycosyltransferase involved in cell wall biosynthesis